MNFITLLNNLFEKYNFKFDLNKIDNECAIRIDEKTVINLAFDHEKQSISIYSILFPVNENNVYEMSYLLLKENAFGKLSGSCAISYIENRHVFLLSKILPIHLQNPETFFEEFTSFVSALQRVRNLWMNMQEQAVTLSQANHQQMSVQPKIDLVQGKMYLKG